MYTPLTKLLAGQARPGKTHDGVGTKAETYSSISATNQYQLRQKMSVLMKSYIRINSSNNSLCKYTGSVIQGLVVCLSETQFYLQFVIRQGGHVF